MAGEAKDGSLSIEAINEDLISSYLSTANYPDRIIRTSGENRAGNFLMYKLLYRIVFTKTLWPDFKKEHFTKP